VNASDCLFQSSARFWDNLRGLVHPRRLMDHASVCTSFSAGFCEEGFNMCEAQLQPHYLERSADGGLVAGRDGLALHGPGYHT